MTTAGRRPFSMRTMRAARAGSWALADWGALGEAIARSSKERARSAARAAKTIASFLKFERMAGNRITFLQRGIGDRLRAEEIDEQFGNAGGFFVLEPVRSIGKGIEFGGIAIAKAVVRHIGQEEGVAFAPEDARGDVDGWVRKFCAMAKCGAIPVDHGGERAGLRPGGAIFSEVVLGEGSGAA